jgi:ElaB/YqjD/DUF883 family membrane-anchored ribosome-binding protein
MPALPPSPQTRQDHVDHMLSMSPAWAASLWTRTQASLRAASADLALAHDRQLLYQVAEWLQGQRQRLELDFVRHLREAVQGGPASSPKALPKDIHELTLVDEAQAEREIEVSRTVQWIDLEADWELREMQAFAAMLPGSAGPLDAQTASPQQTQPFRPATFARALSHTVNGLGMPDEERAMMLRLSGKCLASVLKHAYAQECQRLREAGVSPRSFKAPSHGVPASGADPSAATSPQVDVTQPGTLSELVRKHPALAQNTAATPPPEAPVRAPGGVNLNLDTDAMLRTLQRNLPPGGQAPGAAAGPGAPGRPLAGTVDGTQAAALLGRMWATMSRDLALQPPVRAMIGHLQEAAQHLARQQPAVIDDPRHPMWRLLNQLADTAAGYAHADDAELQAFLTHIGPQVARVARQRPPRSSDFSDTLQHAEEFLQQQGRQQLTEAQPQVSALRTDDRRQALRPLLSQQIEQQMAQQLGDLLRPSSPDRVRTGPDAQPSPKRPRLPKAIPRFLQGAWVDVLTHVMSTDAPDADSRLQSLLATTETLLASLKPPASTDEQQALRSGLPALVQQVQEAMAGAGLSEAQQTAALDALMVVHTQYLRLPPRAPLPASSFPVDEDTDPDEPAMRERPWGVNTDIGHLPTVPMALMGDGRGPSVAGTPQWLDALQPGAWLKQHVQGQWCTTRVLWVSEHRAYVVVKDRQSGQLHSLTRGALSRLHEAGLVTGLQERSLVQRTVDSLLQDIGPDAGR